MVIHQSGQSLKQANPYWKMLAALNSQGKIVAHIVCYIEPYQALGNTAFILQWENDEGLKEPEIARVGRKLVWDWVSRLRIKNIMTVTTDERHARLFRRYGLEPFRVILRQEMKYEGV